MIQTLHRPDGTQTQVHLGGWKKQYIDTRDEPYRLKLNGSFLGALPGSVDRRPFCSPVEDQGNLGSCTAQMFASLIEANELRQNTKLAQIGGMFGAATATVSVSNVAVASDGTITFTTSVKPPVPAPTPTPAPAPNVTLVHASRLFEYYATRRIMGTTGYDSGATIRDTIKAGVVYGVVDEVKWPYNIAQFKTNPPSSVWTAAASKKVTSYHAVSNGDIETMKSVLYSGYLVGFGFRVFEYMLSLDMAQKGILTRPGRNEVEVGGHAVTLVGYDNSKQAFLVRNSWGANWGIGGYYWMAYDYVGDPNLSSDFWVVKSTPL